jgi:hypothetical protein
MRRATEMRESSSVRHEPVRRDRQEVDGVFPLMPQQYYDLISRRHLVDGERRLLFAVFEDAIRTYVSTMHTKSLSRRKEFEEVRDWMNIKGEEGVFSFDSLCSLFNVDADLLRRQLATLHSTDLPRRRIGSIGRRVPISAVS